MARGRRATARPSTRSTLTSGDDLDQEFRESGPDQIAAAAVAAHRAAAACRAVPCTSAPPSSSPWRRRSKPWATSCSIRVVAETALPSRPSHRRARPHREPVASLRLGHRGGSFLGRRHDQALPTVRRCLARTCAWPWCRWARSPSSGRATFRWPSRLLVATPPRHWPPAARSSSRHTRPTRECPSWSPPPWSAPPSAQVCRRVSSRCFMVAPLRAGPWSPTPGSAPWASPVRGPAALPSSKLPPGGRSRSRSSRRCHRSTPSSSCPELSRTRRRWQPTTWTH